MGSERRRHERFPLQTQVEVTHFHAVHQLRVLNMSRSGLFLEVEDFDDMPELIVGAELNVRLFDESADEDEDVLVMAEVVRVEEGGGLVASGIGVAFTEIGEEDELLLERLLVRAGSPASPPM
jgi:hypothetical protein